MPRALPGQAAGGDAIVVPYAAIIKLIPQELWGKLAPAGVAGYNYTIPRRTVLEQLPHGAVKVNFGELRRGAPSGVFINTTAEDGRLVDLPLSDILGQLHPDSLSRRPDQARVQVSNEVPDLFGSKGERLAPLRVMEKKELSHTTSFARQKGSAPVAPKAATPAAPTVPASPAPVAPNNVTAIPANLIVPGPSLASANPAPTIKMQPPPPSAPSPAAPSPAPASRPAAPFPFSIPKPAVAAPVATAAPAARPLPKIPLSKTAPGAPIPAPAIPAPPLPSPVSTQAPVPAVPTISTGTSFFMALDVVAAGWPDGVRQELAQLKIPDAKIALPPVDLCEGLKRGRIQYPWRTLRSWIQPTPIYAAPSPHDDLVLELPLGSLTPLFLDFIRANPVNRQVADAGNITEFFRKAEQVSSTSADLLQPLFTGSPQPAQPPIPTPPPAAAPAATPAPVVTPSATAQPAAPPDIRVETETLCLPVQVLANGCPEAVLHDIASFGLANSRIEVPLATIEAGLKAGRIEFTWRELCNWLNPPSKPAQVSINGENRIALPLGVIAPLFLKARVAGQGRKKTNVAEDIPDLFSAAGKPLAPAEAPAPAPAAIPSPTMPAAVTPAPAVAAAPPAPPAPAPVQVAAPTPVAAPVPTAAPAPVSPPAKPVAIPATPAVPVPAPAAAAPKKAAANLSELFGEPNKKTWTPNEIVQRTTQLPNVAGALIALQDGLLVASNMPPELRTETVAAFVPQIFGRLNQYSKELQMGETKAVSFTVSTGTMQVYNAGIIYFAALSKAGTLLPLAELQLIAGELGRHTK